MHDTAFAIGQIVLRALWRQARLRVVEVGSQDVNGTLRDALPRGCEYIGIDMARLGRNVDLVSLGTHIALPDGTADLTVASSTFEHDPLFWMTFLELCRITKRDGFIYLAIRAYEMASSTVTRSIAGAFIPMQPRLSPRGQEPRGSRCHLCGGFPSQQSAAGTFGTTSWLSSRADPCRRANGRNLSTGTFMRQRNSV